MQFIKILSNTFIVKILVLIFLRQPILPIERILYIAKNAIIARLYKKLYLTKHIMLYVLGAQFYDNPALYVYDKIIKIV